MLPEHIGVCLKEARKKNSISIERVAEQTRIPKDYLVALESGNFEALPGRGYVLGYIRNYCKVIELDPEPIINAYKSAIGKNLAKPIYKFPVQALVPKMAGSMIAMFIVLTALAGYVGWVILGDNPNAPAQVAVLSVTPPASQNGLSSPSSPQKQTPPATGQSDIAQNETSTPSPEAALPINDNDQTIIASNDPVQGIQGIIEEPSDQSASPFAPDNSAIGDSALSDSALSESGLDNTGPDNTADSESVIPLQLETTDQQIQTESLNDPVIIANAVAAQANQRLPLQEIIITAHSSSWVEIVRSDGESVISKLMQKGDRLVTTADENLFLSTGNAGGLKLEMKDVPAFQSGKLGEILRDLPLNREAIDLRRGQLGF